MDGGDCSSFYDGWGTTVPDNMSLAAVSKGEWGWRTKNDNNKIKKHEAIVELHSTEQTDNLSTIQTQKKPARAIIYLPAADLNVGDAASSPN